MSSGVSRRPGLGFLAVELIRGCVATGWLATGASAMVRNAVEPPQECAARFDERKYVFLHRRHPHNSATEDLGETALRRAV